MTILDVSCNDISKVPYEIALMKKLRTIVLEGNAIRSIRHNILTGPTIKLKEYLKSRINYDTISESQFNLRKAADEHVQIPNERGAVQNETG